MLGLDKEVAAVAQQPTAERVQGLKRIIPCSTIKSILKQVGQTQPCPRLPKWFMVWFVIGMGLFSTDCYRQVFYWVNCFLQENNPQRAALVGAPARTGRVARRLVVGRGGPVRWGAPN